MPSSTSSSSSYYHYHHHHSDQHKALAMKIRAEWLHRGSDRCARISLQYCALHFLYLLSVFCNCQQYYNTIPWTFWICVFVFAFHHSAAKQCTALSILLHLYFVIAYHHSTAEQCTALSVSVFAFCTCVLVFCICINYWNTYFNPPLHTALSQYHLLCGELIVIHCSQPDLARELWYLPLGAVCSVHWIDRDILFTCRRHDCAVHSCCAVNWLWNIAQNSAE